MITTLINQIILFNSSLPGVKSLNGTPARVVAVFESDSSLQLAVVSMTDGQIYQAAVTEFRVPPQQPSGNMQMMGDQQVAGL